MHELPIFIAIYTGLGLFLSYLFGLYGFLGSVLVWSSILFFKYPELLKGAHLIFANGVVISWWLSTLCLKSYMSAIESVQLSAEKNKEDLSKLQLYLAEVTNSNRKEKQEYEKLISELESTVEDLRHQITAHRHHLSIAWQETHQIKEELEKQKKESQSNIDYLHRQCMYHIQCKNYVEASLEKTQLELEKVVSSHELQHLETISLLEEKIAFAQKENLEKEKELDFLKESLSSIQMEYAFEDRQEVVCDQDINWQAQYQNLKGQFDEKSTLLDETRKELFLIENTLLTLVKQNAENNLTPSDEEDSIIISFQKMTSDNLDLEKQVEHLEQLVATLLQKIESQNPEYEYMIQELNLVS